jgi:hypothetical protein
MKPGIHALLAVWLATAGPAIHAQPMPSDARLASNDDHWQPAAELALSDAPQSASAAASSVQLTRWSIATGGGHASHGGVVLHATLGQPQPGSAAGGSISLQSGFWFASSSPPPAAGRIFGNGFE